MKRLFVLALTVLFTGLIIGNIVAAEVTKPENTNKAPDFTLTSTTGETVKLSDYSGKIVVLEWANPDCPFVKRHYEAKTMQNLAEKYKAQDVVWLAISSTHFHDNDRLTKWISEAGIAHPVLNDKDGTVGKLYGAKTTPHMFVIDTKGDLVYNGAIDNDASGDMKTPVNYVDQVLTQLTAGQGVTQEATKPYGCSVKYS